MTEHQLYTLLIAAVGGQGGGVLAEWVVEAATEAGLLAHATSIPGVAQRTGSTTYYVELFTGPREAAPAFSLYPVPGMLDVLLAPEFLELGRAIEQGIPSPGRTTIVTSTHRVYSIHEKMAAGHGIYPAGELAVAARAFSRRLIAFDALAVARERDTEVNAVLLGALAGSESLPMAPAHFRSAIRRRGVAVEMNLRGFEAGLAWVDRGVPAGAEPPRRPFRPPPPELAARVATFPARLQALLGEAVTRLVDYQDVRYAERYLQRLAPFVAAGADLDLAAVVARHLAVWMAYEDAIRVADLKTRRSRFARLRAEAGPGPVAIQVTDYLRPELDELFGILPAPLAAPVARWAERRWPTRRPTLGQRVHTTTVLGFLRLWLLARCRRLRPVSYRARLEHARMDRWLAAVQAWAHREPALAAELARAAQLIKGYGEVRRRLSALFDHLLASVDRVAALEIARGARPVVAHALARAVRTRALEGTESPSEIMSLGEDAARWLEREGPEVALARLGGA